MAGMYTHSKKLISLMRSKRVFDYNCQGRALIPRPSSEDLYNLVRNPMAVEKPSSTVMFYSILAASQARSDPNSTVSQGLWKNLMIALESKELYLDCSEDNILALTFLAAHYPYTLTPKRC